MNQITITKLPNGNYHIVGPDCDVTYETAHFTMQTVREQLNLLQFPPANPFEALAKPDIGNIHLCHEDHTP